MNYKSLLTHPFVNIFRHVLKKRIPANDNLIHANVRFEIILTNKGVDINSTVAIWSNSSIEGKKTRHRNSIIIMKMIDSFGGGAPGNLGLHMILEILYWLSKRIYIAIAEAAMRP